MSMQLRVVHTTEFEYDGLAAASYNQARMTPVTAPGQIVVHSRLDVHPKPWTSEYRDYFGAQVITFEVLDPHDAMSVVATSTVQVERASAAPPTTPWEEYGDRAVADRWTEYLTLPSIVAIVVPILVADVVVAVGGGGFVVKVSSAPLLVPPPFAATSRKW